MSLKFEENKKVDLVVDCDYLGNFDIESKYLTTSIIKWLIAEIKLIDSGKKIPNCLLEVNITKNNLVMYKKDDLLQQEIVFNHKLSDLFKLTYLTSDPMCFGYFYRKNNTSFNYYTLHVFKSNKSNLCQVLNDFQHQAIKLHENLIYEKMFDFKLVTKLVINQDDLNIPNFIEICLDKANSNNTNSKNVITNSLNKILKNKIELYLQLLTNKRVLFKFTPNRLIIQESDQESIELEYKNVLYLNNSITNENFFCLAYSNTSHKTPVNALILYSNNVEVIDDVIREYAINVSSELNNTNKKIEHQSFDEEHFAKPEHHTCGLCPMQQFVELCNYLDNFDQNQTKIYNFLIEKLNNNIDLSDQNFIIDCLKSYENLSENLQDKIELIVALIHKLCVKRQVKHLKDIINSRTSSNNLILINSGILNSKVLSKSVHTDLVNFNNNSKKRIQRSNTLDSPAELKNTLENPIKNIEFSKLLNHSSTNNLIESNTRVYHNKAVSSKKNIFTKIVGSPYTINQTDANKQDQFRLQRFKSSYEIRQFWKKIISEQIILIKMEKENLKMSYRLKYAQQNKINLNKSTFSYVEITPCLKEVDKTWEKWLSLDDEESDEYKSISLDEIRKNVFRGVPQNKREKIWFWLIKKHKNMTKNLELKKSNLRFDLSYREILNQSTIHQHAILLDLARTFPNHPNFSKKYGPGQLALFNVLKAYSILDSQVGYCQGLSFIVGILLIHVNNNEEKAFNLLKFLLIDLDFREQYKPDMIQLQKYMYQFSRFLEDNCEDVFAHFENYDVSASLYAAPWFLTLFSSQFQIGFVARVFDFLFAEGYTCLFKLSLSILSIHKPLLQSCDSFESIVSHLKTTIPEMSLIESELIINKSYAFGYIESKLNKYEIEFGVLYEDFSNVQNSLLSNTNNSKKEYRNNRANSLEIINNLESDNLKLKNECKDLREHLQLLQLQINNQDSHFLKLHTENKHLKCQVETLEMEKQSLLKIIRQQDKKLNSLIK
ncbi:unnamed protein product [Brachionus calyciflorus]|uniref:Rab-GAP TBC domain-containing protein n=1 Tax=Brachionus calyciflorus TaxID=104777 RepID=A0A814FRC0_9BILA|nr:unnamed protein product [Brachionus calyciflorus]